ncbi:MAG: hypothetical protein AB1772_08445 [Candidatus Zixiibacteriota bacterium]
MRITKGHLLSGLLGCGGLVWLWVSGCEDKPTEPRPPEPQTMDYVLYWSKNQDDSVFLAYHTLTGELDTFYLQGSRVFGLKASADGKRLFIDYADRIRVVNTAEWYVSADLPYSGSSHLAVSPDNQHLAVQGESLRIIAACDYSLLFSDTLATDMGVFTVDGKRFYAPGPSTRCRSIYRLDLAGGFNVDYICVPDEYRIFRVVPSVDERLLFMFRDLGDCYMLFDVFDIAADSLVFRDLVAPGCGDIVVSPDNDYVYFTGPGSILVGPPPAYTFARYSLGEKQIDSLIFWSTCDLPFPTGILGDNIAMIPNGRLLAVTEFAGLNRLVLYDCREKDTLTVECLIGAGFYHLTCQNAR